MMDETIWISDNGIWSIEDAGSRRVTIHDDDYNVESHVRLTENRTVRGDSDYGKIPQYVRKVAESILLQEEEGFAVADRVFEFLWENDINGIRSGFGSKAEARDFVRDGIEDTDVYVEMLTNLKYGGPEDRIIDELIVSLIGPQSSANRRRKTSKATKSKPRIGKPRTTGARR